MAFKPPLKAGKKIRVTYQAADTSDGRTFVRVLWIPKDGSAVPEPGHTEVSPGETGVIEATIPSDTACRWMELWADLPEPNGSGWLTIQVDDKPHSSGAVTADTLWTAMVVP